MSYKHPAWTKFFAARTELVDVLHKEGATDKQIANHISASPAFVEMIRTLRGEPEAKKELVRGSRVRLLHTKMKCPIPAGTEGKFINDHGRFALVAWCGLTEEQARTIEWPESAERIYWEKREPWMKYGFWVPIHTLEVL